MRGLHFCLMMLCLQLMIDYVAEGNTQIDRQTQLLQGIKNKDRENEFVYEVLKPLRNARRRSRNSGINYKYYKGGERSSKNTQTERFADSEDSQNDYRLDSVNSQSNEQDDYVNDKSGVKSRLRKNTRKFKTFNDHINDVRQDRSMQWGASAESNKRTGRDHSEQGNHDVPHEDLDPEPNLDREDLESEPHEDPEPDDDNGEINLNPHKHTHGHNPYHEYFEPAPSKTPIKKPYKFWHPAKKFFRKKTSALCRLYTHHEKGVESILSSILNVGSKPVHSAIMKYCNQSTESSEKGAEDKSPMGKLFDWLSKRLGSSSKKKEPTATAADESPPLLIDKDDSMVIQPKVVNLILSPKAALKVHEAINDKMDLESHEENLERLEEEALEAERLREEVHKDWEENAHDEIKHSDALLEEKFDDGLDENLREEINENIREHLEEKGHDEEVKKVIDEEKHDQADEEILHDEILEEAVHNEIDHEALKGHDEEIEEVIDEEKHEQADDEILHEQILEEAVHNEIDQEALKEEIWDEVAKTLKDSYKNEEHQVRVGRNPLSLETKPEHSCVGAECFKKEPRNVASEEDSVNDLEKLANLLRSLKIKRKKSLGDKSTRIAKAEKAEDSSKDEEKYYNFLERFTMPTFESDKFENEGKEEMSLIGDIVAAERDPELLRPNHHHHPTLTKLGWSGFEDVITRNVNTLLIILAVILCPILLIVLFFCCKRGLTRVKKLVDTVNTERERKPKVEKEDKKVKKKVKEEKPVKKLGKSNSTPSTEEAEGTLAEVTVHLSAGESDAESVSDREHCPQPLTKKGKKLTRTESVESDKKRNKPRRNKSPISSKSKSSSNEQWLISEGSYSSNTQRGKGHKR